MDTNGKVLLARLYEKTSANGNRYFAGRIGAAKVAMFLDRRAEGDTPVWELFVQDGDKPRQTAPETRPAPPPPEPPVAPRRRNPGRSSGRGARAHADWQAPLDRAADLDMPLPLDMQ